MDIKVFCWFINNIIYTTCYNVIEKKLFPKKKIRKQKVQEPS